MPIVRYIVWVGTSLLALLFVANWFPPESLPEPAVPVGNSILLATAIESGDAPALCERSVA